MNIEKVGLIKDPIVLKGLTMILITAFLLIPLAIIGNVIKDRNWTRKDAENELLESYGGALVLTSPVLLIPYNARYIDENNDIKYMKKNAYFLPETLNINGKIDPIKKRRGIYEFLLYNSSIVMDGEFSTPDFKKISDDIDSIYWEKAKIIYEISNIKGYTGRPDLVLDGVEYELDKGSYTPFVYSGGLSAPVLVDRSKDSLSFTLKSPIQGGKSLGFIPLGAETNLNLASQWDSPSFFGANLPVKHTIVEDEGFSSNWYINSFSRDFSDAMRSDDVINRDFNPAIFGVRLLFPVDLYLMAERCIKYGALFLILPFITFFLMEIFTNKRVHIFHYLFVGITSILFFLLLLAFGEHFSFYIAYIVGVVMVSILITYYSCHFLNSVKHGLLLFPIMLIAYLFMYIMINSEDYALLMGSLGLFTVVGGIMVATKNIDWYSFGKQGESLE